MTPMLLLTSLLLANPTHSGAVTSSGSPTPPSHLYCESQEDAVIQVGYGPLGYQMNLVIDGRVVIAEPARHLFVSRDSDGTQTTRYTNSKMTLDVTMHADSAERSGTAIVQQLDATTVYSVQCIFKIGSIR